MNPNQALWEKGDFTEIAAFMRQSGEAVIQTIGMKPPMRVLDLGCGDGTTAIPLARLGAEVVGIDIARNLVEAGNRRATEAGLTRLKFQEGDACNLEGVADRSFDVDADPVRPSGVSATDAEHEAALDRVRTVRDGLAAEGWPMPILADSGNGGHLLYSIDLPNDPTATQLVNKCLKVINQRYGDARVGIDETVGNAGRITKLYGTVARKGDHTPERPHRLSKILEAPETLVVVPEDLLVKLGAEFAEPMRPAVGSKASGFQLEDWLARHCVRVRRGPLPWEGRGEKWELEACLFNEEHTGGCAVITRGYDGRIGFRCQHNSCSGKGWRELRELLVGHQETAVSVIDSATEHSEEASSVRAGDVIPAFPETAWRGTFADYRNVMAGTTEASDVAHFVTLWACFAVALGRRISFYLGDLVYPNVYLDFYGPTGDKKTTAERRSFQLLRDVPGARIIQAVGSTEGLADALTIPPVGADHDAISLFFWEELSALLAQGGWKGSTIFEFITQTFDCPPEWSLKYRQKPISIPRPTPTILTATTPDWFWRHARPQDFHGGFGNRFAHFTDRAKSPIPRPTQPDTTILDGIREKLTALSCVTPTKMTLSPQAARLWDAFYIDWSKTDRSPLLAAAVKRLPVYVLKLAMVYAADEGTLPVIAIEQLQAAIGVVLYSEQCAEHLLGLQTINSSATAELEDRFVKWVDRNAGNTVRRMQMALFRYTGGAEMFNRVLNNLQKADRIDVRQDGPKRRVFPG